MKYLLLIISLCLSSSIVAQQREEEIGTQQVTEILIVEDKDGSGILDIQELDETPEFPGGNEALIQFLSSNIIYPAQCAENEIQGRVIVRFTVFKDGSVGNFNIVNSVHPLLDEEALRVVSLMPNWKPGKLGGKPVQVWYTLPISFQLANDNADTPTLSERDQADFEQFLVLGHKSESEANVNHAFQYYKECFNIKPWEFYLLDKIDSLIVGKKEIQDQFYRWALSRMLREAEKNWGNADDYISHMVTLQEKVVALNGRTIETLYPLEFLYFQALDFKNVQHIASTIYAMIPSDDSITLAQVMDMDANSRIYQKDYKGVVALVAPKVDVLLTQDSSDVMLAPFFELLEAYIRLEQDNNAKDLIQKVRNKYPLQFDEIVEKYADVNPQMQSKFLQLIK